jgi:dUTP pyrophosphatase
MMFWKKKGEFMIIKFKKLTQEAITPSYAKEGDAGLDLTAISRRWDSIYRYWEYGTGLSFEIPVGHVGLLFPRSSISNKSLSLSNSVGVLDSGYRGEIKFRFKSALEGYEQHLYQPGDRIGQLIVMPYPQVTLVESDQLSSSHRSEGGYGSSGT